MFFPSLRADLKADRRLIVIGAAVSMLSLVVLVLGLFGYPQVAFSKWCARPSWSRESLRGGSGIHARPTGCPSWANPPLRSIFRSPSWLALLLRARPHPPYFPAVAPAALQLTPFWSVYPLCFSFAANSFFQLVVSKGWRRYVCCVVSGLRWRNFTTRGAGGGSGALPAYFFRAGAAIPVRNAPLSINSLILRCRFRGYCKRFPRRAFGAPVNVWLLLLTKTLIFPLRQICILLTIVLTLSQHPYI